MTAPDRRTVTLAGLAMLAACGKQNRQEVDGVADESRAPLPLSADFPRRAPGDARQLEEQLASVLAQSGAPGISAALIDRDGVVFEAASGLRRMGAPDAVTVDDPWHIGSDTKAMTAALYARLVDAGRAEWGAALPNLFPDLAADMEPFWSRITIEHVLSHRSGIGEVGVTWLLARRTDGRPMTEQRTETARQMLTKKPAGAPGKFQYSNANYIIAGAAIERITGSGWEEAIRADVFEPLGMDRAGFGPPLGDAPQGHRADMFSRLKPAGVGPGADNPHALAPAGTVHLPLSDWARFVAVFLDPGQTFLSADSVERLTRPPPGADYALGWGVLTDPEAGQILTHAGSNTMWYAQVIAAPERGTGILVATNCAGEAGPNAVGAVSKAMRPLLTAAPGAIP